MFAVNVTIKVQNELAKKAIILALKDWSHDLFQNNGLMLRCFVDRTENQVEIFHVFKFSTSNIEYSPAPAVIPHLAALTAPRAKIIRSVALCCNVICSP